MKKLLPVLILFSMGLFMSACEKADPQNDGELIYSFSSINLNATLGATGATSGQIVQAGTNGSINWTSGTVSIAKIEFEAKKGGSAVSVEYKNLSNINVLTPGQVAGSIVLPAGKYTEVGVKLNLAESSANMPLVLKGTYIEVSGTQIPVEFQFNETLQLKVEGQQFEIKGDKYTAEVKLELNNLVKGIAASEFGQTTRTNGKILITNSINRPLYEKLLIKLASTANVQIKHQ